LTQTKYIERILARFNIEDAKRVSLPLAAHFKLSYAQCPTIAEKKRLMSKVFYVKGVGSLMYLMVYTKPKISLAMSKVSRYMSNLRKVHWEGVKWILRYVNGTKDVGLLFDGYLENAKSLLDYVDVDYGQDLSGRKSTTVYVFTLRCGCISWRPTSQKCISQSTTKAEYVAAKEAVKEEIWLEKLITKIGLQHGSEAPRPWKGANLHAAWKAKLHAASSLISIVTVKVLYTLKLTK
jgi:hypothetical protein